MIKIVECPRDAMQGLPQFIPTELKARYINSLLKVGFHTIDFGSFVSPKAIPQMRDTADVMSKLDLSTTPSKLLAIVANFISAPLPLIITKTVIVYKRKVPVVSKKFFNLFI